MELQRRGLLRGLAFGVPAVLAGLQLAGATAHADDDDRGRGRGRGRGREIELEDENENENQGVRRNNATFSADLVPTNSIGGDFGAGAGDNGRGSVTVFSSSGSANSIRVALRGANANTTYTLMFQFLNGSRTGLGTLTSNSAGNANAFFSDVLSEPGPAASNGLGTRVGVFVLTKAGGDAFVSAA